MKEEYDISRVSDTTLASLLMFARRRGYVLDKVYTTDNQDPRPCCGRTWVRAKLTHWSGCTRRAWYDGLKWRWA